MSGNNRSAKSRKEKKSKSSTNLPSTSSTPDSQPVIYDEEELERQYQGYKKQFDEWTAKHKGAVTEEAYNNYVEQFKKWEKEIEQRRKYIKSHKDSLAKQSSSKTEATANGGSSNPSSASAGSDSNTFDPSAMMNPYSMMMMMATMMMPFVMMNPAAVPKTDATPSTAIAAPPAFTVPPSREKSHQQSVGFSPSISEKPTIYKHNDSFPNFVGPSPRTPPPPPSQMSNFIPVSNKAPVPLSSIVAARPPSADYRSRPTDYDRIQRGQRSNDRYFDNAHSLSPRASRFRDAPNGEYDDYWYRRFRERRVAESEIFHGPQTPSGSYDRIFRGTNYEPLHRAPEPWTQSGLGANDFSMRRQERQQPRF